MNKLGQTAGKIESMRTGGKLLGGILKKLIDEAQAGMSLLEIEAQAQAEIQKAGGKPSFPTVRGYHWATCLCVNDEVVHGIPNEYILKNGDLLTIDIGMIYEGWHTDTAWTRIIGDTDRPELIQFLEVGQDTLFKAIDNARSGNRIGHISRVIQDGIVGHGYAVIKSLVGHGVGGKLHEDPQIPGFLYGPVEKTPQIKTGMTLAIEIIYAHKKGEIVGTSDGWTLKTQDKSMSAVFEHTVAVTETGPVVLTQAEN